ncbi:MAG TPA: hypothetical protein VE709_04055 [Pseudonocardiaceae bacterium]|nr:hypothetical protein [Pseudonocardiaceae bacterium]
MRVSTSPTVAGRPARRQLCGMLARIAVTLDLPAQAAATRPPG